MAENKDNMYALSAELFAYVAEEVVKRFGEEGEQAVREGVRKFGTARGRRIRENANRAGDKPTLENYLKNYDMERSKLFDMENSFSRNRLLQSITRCPFAGRWKELGLERYGKLYCSEIDRALIKGYNSKLTMELREHLLENDNRCCLDFYPEEE